MSAEIPLSRGARLGRLGALTGSVARRLVEGQLRSSFGDRATREAEQERALRDSAARVARGLGQLKGAAMKAGQGLAMAADHLDLPDEVRGQLSRLHDRAEPVPFETVRQVVEGELEGSLETLFATFSREPLGTASLAQAHAATLHDGTRVVVKVLHPGVEASVDIDLAAVRTMLRGLPGTRARRAELDAAFDEVRARLHEELDYLHEAAHVETFRRQWAGDDRVVVPRTYPALSTSRVLTLDRLDGSPIDSFLGAASPEARQRAGLTLAHLFLRSTLVHRTLHADPHPGNYLFVPDGTVQLLDFGCVKRFDEHFVAGWARVVLGALDGDRGAALQAARDIEIWIGDDPAAGKLLWTFCRDVLGPFAAGPVTVGAGDETLVRAAARHSRAIWRTPELQGPPDLVFLHRTLGGMYSLIRRTGATADWGALLREHGTYAIEHAAGRR